MPVADADLELLATTLMDIRATVDSMRRSLTNAQSSIEQYRHTRSKDVLSDVSNCLEYLTDEGSGVSEAIAEATRAIQVLLSR